MVLVSGSGKLTCWSICPRSITSPLSRESSRDGGVSMAEGWPLFAGVFALGKETS